MTRPDPLLQASAQRRHALEARFARAISVRLSERAEAVEPDIAERLRFAREKAVAVARQHRAPDRVVAGGASGGAAVAALGRSPFWWKLGSALPLAALVIGLLWIQNWQSSVQISTAAEVDAELLGDDLPIHAYKDAGFLEFLKSQPEQ